jgi:hypothetical protein
MRSSVTIALSIISCLSAAGAASAQTPLATVSSSATTGSIAEPPAASIDAGMPRAQAVSSDDWKFSIYPILLWVPALRLSTNVPPFPDTPGGPDLPGDSGSSSSSFDGAALAGFSLAKSSWRVDADGIWAALGTERDRPLLKTDVDVIYGHVAGGVKIYKDLYVIGGVRRLALKYDIQLNDRPHFVRKPGLWDPLVGLGWHSALGSRFTLHVTGEGGGFGAGADVDLSGSVRADARLVGPVGLTFGYSILYLKLSDTVLQRTLEVKQTLHGPIIGVGLYF